MLSNQRGEQSTCSIRMEFPRAPKRYGEFVGAVGVVVTLAYLAVQIPLNTRSNRMSAELECSKLLTDWVGRVSASRDSQRCAGKQTFRSLGGGDRFRPQAGSKALVGRGLLVGHANFAWKVKYSSRLVFNICTFASMGKPCLDPLPFSEPVHELIYCIHHCQTRSDSCLSLRRKCASVSLDRRRDQNPFIDGRSARIMNGNPIPDGHAMNLIEPTNVGHVKRLHVRYQYRI